MNEKRIMGWMLDAVKLKRTRRKKRKGVLGAGLMVAPSFLNLVCVAKYFDG